MQRVSIDDVPVEDLGRDVERRSLTDPLGAENVAANRYVLEPGQGFAGSVHAHTDQEELFVVVRGEAAFETDAGEVRVTEGEAIRFAPGEFQRGRNDGDGDLVAFAIGAPRDGGHVLISRIEGYGDVACPDCGHDHMRIPDERGTGLVCPKCGGRLQVE